jgi:serine/threonine-protein kinase RsbT
MTRGARLVVEKDETIGVRVSDDVVRVRQAVRARAIEAGFGIVDQTKLVTAASEIARNTVDYGGGGTLRIEIVREGARRGVQLTFSDKGPGIADIKTAMADGYTTGGGLGLGLSGAKRL